MTGREKKRFPGEIAGTSSLIKKLLFFFFLSTECHPVKFQGILLLVLAEAGSMPR